MQRGEGGNGGKGGKRGIQPGHLAWLTLRASDRARLGELGQLDQVLGLAAKLCKLEAHHLGILDAEGAWARQCAANDGRRVRKRRGREVDVARRELRDGRVTRSDRGSALTSIRRSRAEQRSSATFTS